MESFKEQLEKESLRLHEDSNLTFKAHFVAAEKWENLNLRLCIPSIILSVIAGSLALSRIIPYFEIFAGISGFAVAALIALLSFLRPRYRHEIHTKFGNKYLSLRNDIRCFFNIELCTNKSDDELKKRLDKLIAEKKNLDAEGPLLPNWAYREAKKRIESGETEYEVDNQNV